MYIHKLDSSKPKTCALKRYFQENEKTGKKKNTCYRLVKKKYLQISYSTKDFLYQNI